MNSVDFLKDEKFNQCLLLVTSIAMFFPDLHFIFYIFLAVQIFNSRKETTLTFFSKRRLPFFFLFLYIIWGYFTLFYTSNMHEGIKQFGKPLPLLLVALLSFLSSPKKSFQLEKIKDYFILSSLIFSLICIANLFLGCFTGNIIAKINVFGLGDINVFQPFSHRTYASAMLMLSIPMHLENILKHKVRVVFSCLSLLVTIFLIYISGARIALVSSFFLISILSLIYGFRSFSRLKFIGSTLIVMVAFSLLVFSSPRIQKTMWDVQQGKLLSRTFNRYVTWESAIELVKKHPVLGVGIGDAQDALDEIYTTNGHHIHAKDHLNVHNQYLQTCVERGGIGFLLLILFFATLFYSTKGRFRVYTLALILIYGINFMFESMLLRNMGVFPLAFWLILLIVKSDFNKKVEGGKSTFWSTLLLVLCLIFLSGIFAKVLLNNKLDSTSPRTYMTKDYEYVRFDLLPNKEELPVVADGVLINSNKLMLSSDFTSEFMAFDIYRSKVEESVKYEFWCYVSTDCNIKNVQTYIYNKDLLSDVTAYDLSKKGSWQKLFLSRTGIPPFTTYGARLDVKEGEEMVGSVLFTLPMISK